MWKYLNHPNIVPFKGVTLEPPQLVSEWMPGGELRKHTMNNRHASLIGLVSPSPPAWKYHLIQPAVARYCRRSWLSPFVQCGPWRP